MRKNILILIGVVIASCTSKTQKTELSPNPESTNGQYELRLKGHNGDRSLTVYHSDSAVEDFEQNQKVRDHQEILDFVVSTEIADARENQITVRTKTVEKDGTGSLHDFAFPEPDESIDFIYSSDAEVLRADPFPKASIFFLPPISLPSYDVKVGDTWTMDHAWISSNEGLPLNLNMVTIFKGVVGCGPFGKCAELEISGQVEVASESLQKMIRFDSRVWGRLLFSMEKGDVIWSEVRSQDIFKAKGNETRVLSCMVSRTRPPAPAESASTTHDKITCEPSIKMVPSPKLQF